MLAEDSLAASPKVNRLPTGASRVTPRCMPQRMEPRDANQPLYGNLHSNAPHGSQTVNTTQMSEKWVNGERNKIGYKQAMDFLKTESHCVTQADLGQRVAVLPQSLECRDYRSDRPLLVYNVISCISTKGTGFATGYSVEEL